MDHGRQDHPADAWVEAVEGTSHEPWLADFHERYLELTAIDASWNAC